MIRSRDCSRAGREFGQRLPVRRAVQLPRFTTGAALAARSAATLVAAT
jgi:hypothetical protein